ncbi:hypothetical protein B0I35DRAFT_480460 [Stachybotrys elegans]|uniref:Uncharacterized protein n=1 Tax=Stachybotrys elegans TaxID=80388 RepID=A0A8K0WPX8_9HYPO|nr:hypothetical protein B0I35DRAFT_480460 [Stachybotrys elegans]
MTQGHAGDMDRIREDLLQRARAERMRDVEQARPPAQQPEMQENNIHTQETRRFYGLPRIWARRRPSQTDIEASKPSESRLPTIRIPRPTLPRRNRPEPEPEATPIPPPPTVEAPDTSAQPLEASNGNQPSATVPPPTSSSGQSRRERRAQEESSGRQKGRFLFCFPLVKSKRIRSHMLRCFVSGVFLGLLLAVYLGLAVSRRIQNGELTIILILVILLATVFFCYSLLRLCMFVLRGDRERMNSARMARIVGTGHAYAIPSRPIPVVLAQDEEAVGVETTKTTPPAYGLWRESVRVDPNRIFWQRNAAAEPMPPLPNSGPRPPSYASEDGVSYIIEAVPRSTVPVTDVPLPVHPSERGRIETPPSQ